MAAREALHALWLPLCFMQSRTENPRVSFAELNAEIFVCWELATIASERVVVTHTFRIPY
jgi:hypothetical protein